MKFIFKKDTPTRGHGLLEKFLAKKRAEKANSLISENLRKGRILDIGCGTTPYFLTNIEFKRKYGIDPFIKQSSNKNIKLLNVAIEKEKMPFEDDFFDVITMLAVFEHIEEKDIEIVTREIRRVLKKDGLFIITTPSIWAKFPLWLFSRLGFVSKIEINDHRHALSRNKIADFLIRSGFNIHKIKSGYFELNFNMWFTANK